jgi:DNA-binding response OmpR family regulator
MADLKVRPARMTDPQTESPESVESLSEGHGTLLAVVPVNGGSSELAIVGYLLPRAAVSGSVPPEDPPAGLVVDAAQHRVVVRGHDAGLVFREFELLAFLITNQGRVFTRAQLLARVWGGVNDGTTRTVDIHVHRLRRKLGPEYARHLVTVRRVGYMYQPPGSGPEE